MSRAIRKMKVDLWGHLDLEGTTQAEVAKRLGVSQSSVSRLRLKRLEAFSVEALIDMLIRDGKRVTIVVGEE